MVKIQFLIVQKSNSRNFISNIQHSDFKAYPRSLMPKYPDYLKLRGINPGSSLTSHFVQNLLWNKQYYWNAYLVVYFQQLAHHVGRSNTWTTMDVHLGLILKSVNVIFNIYFWFPGIRNLYWSFWLLVFCISGARFVPYFFRTPCRQFSWWISEKLFLFCCCGIIGQSNLQLDLESRQFRWCHWNIWLHCLTHGEKILCPNYLSSSID